MHQVGADVEERRNAPFIPFLFQLFHNPTFSHSSSSELSPPYSSKSKSLSSRDAAFRSKILYSLTSPSEIKPPMVYSSFTRIKTLSRILSSSNETKGFVHSLSVSFVNCILSGIHRPKVYYPPPTPVITQSSLINSLISWKLWFLEWPVFSLPQSRITVRFFQSFNPARSLLYLFFYFLILPEKTKKKKPRKGKKIMFIHIF